MTVAARRWPLTRVVAVVAQILWVLVLWIGFLGKALTDDGGFTEFFRFLTNWTWLLNTLFFTIDLFGYPFPRVVFTYFSAYAFWFVYVVNWVVFWLVFPLLNKNVNLILELTKQQGGELDTGIVMAGDRVYHVLPTVFSLIWALLRGQELQLALAWMGSGLRMSSRAAFSLVWLVPGVACPLIFLGVYRLLHDPMDVYGADLNEVGVVFLVLIVVFVTSGVTLFAVSPLTNSAARRGVSIVIMMLWTALLWIIMLYWFIRYGYRHFSQRFALWVWAFAAVYYPLDIVFPDRGSKRTVDAHEALVWTALWPLCTLVHAVFWLAFVVLSETALPLLDLDGDGLLSGYEVVMDRVIHVLPLVMLLIYFFVRADRIHAVAWLNAASAEPFASALDRSFYQFRFAIYIVVAVYVAPLAVFLVYRTVFDPTLVYGVVSPAWTWFLIFTAIALLFGFGIMYLFRWIGVVESPSSPGKLMAD